MGITLQGAIALMSRRLETTLSCMVARSPGPTIQDLLWFQLPSIDAVSRIFGRRAVSFANPELLPVEGTKLSTDSTSSVQSRFYSLSMDFGGGIILICFCQRAIPNSQFAIFAIPPLLIGR